MIVRMRELVLEELKRSLSNTRNLAVIIAFVIFVSVVPPIILATALPEIPVGGPVTKEMLVNAFIRIYFFTYTISLAVFIIHAISMDVFITDKKEKALDVLLTGPVSIRTLWLAKSASLFVISYPAALSASALFIVSTNLILQEGFKYLPDLLMWVYAITILPSIIFLVIALAGILQMVLKRFSAVNFFLFLIAFIVMGVPSLLISRLAEFDARALFGLYAAITLIMALATAWLQKALLDKERIVLSS